MPIQFVRLGPLLAILAFLAATLWPIVFRREAIYWGDLFLYFYPLEQFVSDTLRAGRLPLWNPFVLCGEPLLGNPQSWVFYPTSLLLLALPVWLYFTVTTVLHLGLAGLGAYLYFRRLTADRIAAVLGGITFCGSGFLMARLQFPTMIQAAAYLPWMLMLADRIIDRPGIGYAAWFALAVGLSLLSAHTQTTYLSLLLVAAYAATRVLHRRRREVRRTWLAVAELTGAVFLGVGLAAVQLLPTLQLFRLSTRTHLTFAQANRFVFEPENLITFLFPHYYGDPVQGNFWGRGNLWEPCVYIGLAPLALAVWAAWQGRRRPAVRFFVVASIVSLWLAMGRFGGLYWVAFHVIPGLKAFHDPARFTFPMTFGLAALAAIGVRLLRDAKVANRWRLALVLASAANLWWFGVRLNPTLDATTFNYRPRALSVVPVWSEGRVFTALREQVWNRYLNYSDFGPDSLRYAHELTNTLAPNIGMRYGVAEASGYEPVPVRMVTDVDGLVRVALARHSARLPDLLRLFDAEALLLPLGTRYPHPALHRVDAPGVAVYAVAEPTPGAWLVRAAIRIDTEERTLAALMSDDFDPRREAVVAGGGELPACSGALPEKADDGSVSIAWKHSERASIDVDAGASPGLVVVSSTWYPGWRARVDGVETPVFRTDHAFLGIPVPRGLHHVELRYAPGAFSLGLYVSLVSAAALSFGLTAGWHSRRRRRARASSALSPSSPADAPARGST